EMEKGQLRADANVSVRPAGSDELRTRTEIKNMNSFNFIARGIEAEVERQIGVWESGGEVEQQTYDFDAATGRVGARGEEGGAAGEGGGGRLPLLPGACPGPDRASCAARGCARRRAARVARCPHPAPGARARPRSRNGARDRRARPALGCGGRSRSRRRGSRE